MDLLQTTTPWWTICKCWWAGCDAGFIDAYHKGIFRSWQFHVGIKRCTKHRSGLGIEWCILSLGLGRWESHCSQWRDVLRALQSHCWASLHWLKFYTHTPKSSHILMGWPAPQMTTRRRQWLPCSCLYSSFYKRKILNFQVVLRNSFPLCLILESQLSWTRVEDADFPVWPLWACLYQHNEDYSCSAQEHDLVSSWTASKHLKCWLKSSPLLQTLCSDWGSALHTLTTVSSEYFV